MEYSKGLNRKNSEIKAYGRRWLILSIFIYYQAVNSFQWIQYSIITNIIMRYYNVSAVAVDWTSIIYMALYSPLVIPATFIIDKKGLRTAALIGCLGTALGTAIKLFSIDHNMFYVVLLGQAILSASQLLILCLPPKIAAVWFKPNEVSTACALGVFGTELGCAIGFVVPPMIIKNHENVDEIGPELSILLWGLTILMIPVSFAVIFCFPRQPPKPPSITQAEERNNREKFSLAGFTKSIKNLLTNGAFVAHMIAYGFNISVSSAMSTLLNQFVLQYFPDSEEDAGRMGLFMIILGMIGTVVFGIILDKTHKYKLVNFLIYFLSSLSVGAFIFGLTLKSKLLVYLALGLFGLLTFGYMSAGFELAMELTFPSPESTSTGILMAMSQILAVINTLVLGKLNANFGPIWGLGSQAGVLIIGSVIQGFIPNRVRRQDAFKAGMAKNNIEFAKIPINEKIDDIAIK